jgi:hypothetical protein
MTTVSSSKGKDSSIKEIMSMNKQLNKISAYLFKLFFPMRRIVQ